MTGGRTVNTQNTAGDHVKTSSRAVTLASKLRRKTQGPWPFWLKWGSKPRRECPLHLPSRQPHQDSSRARFLFAVHVAWPLLLDAQSSCVERLVVLVRVRSLWWNVGTQLGRSQPCAGLVGRLSRSLTALCAISHPPEVISKRGTAVEMPLLPSLNVPAGFLGVTRRVNSRHQAVKTQLWRIARSLTKLRFIRRSNKRQIAENSHKSKKQSLDDEKAALLAANRPFLPLQSRIEKQKNCLERVSKEMESKQQNLLEILQTLNETEQELQPTQNRPKQNTRWRFWWPNKLQKLKSCQSRNSSGSDTHTAGSTPDQAAKQATLPVIKSVLSMHSMGCHSVSEQLMAAGATDEDVEKLPNYGTNSSATGSREHASPNQDSRPHSLPCEVVGSDEEFSTGESVPGISKMDIEGQEAIEKRVQKKKQTTGEEVQTRGRRVVTHSASGSGLNSSQNFFPALSRVGEADNPGPACPIAKLFSAQFSTQLASGPRICPECRQNV